MHNQVGKCCKKINNYDIKRDGKTIFVSLLIALLPKCPFCIFAYSSTIVMCSSTKTEHFQSPTTIILSSILCLIVLLSILFNYRDSRTTYAFLLALIGSFIILNSVIFGGGESSYYFGLLIVFIGIWLNGSMLWFMERLKTTKTWSQI